MLPVITIVGRPNVGKSTLFNKLTKSRDALVANMAGVTRDRQYGHALFEERPFIVVDTGGLVGEQQGIQIHMEGQARQAIQEADLVLFVVDGRGGCTAADLSIANELRQLAKPCLLVVNKTDGLDQDIAIADFYQFGFDKVTPIAATHGRGVAKMLTMAFAAIPNDQPDVQTSQPISEPEDKGISVAIVGRPNVGKSTLVNRILGEDRVVVYDLPGTTRDSIHIPFERREQKFTLIDTAGVRRRTKVKQKVETFSIIKTLQAINEAHVVVLIIDARENISDQDLRLLGYILDSGRSIVIAVNKWDGLAAEDKLAVRKELSRRLVFIDYAKLHTISALHGTGVGDLYDSIVSAYTSATQRHSTAKLNRILEQALTRTPPPMVRGRRIKLSYTHLGGHNPPIIVIHGNQTESVPESYRRYLSSFFRKALKLVGTPIRIEFKTGDNPYKGRKNSLTDKQKNKRKRFMKHIKKTSK